MVNIVKKIVPESRYYLKCPYEMTPTRIVVHNTAIRDRKSPAESFL